MVRVARKGTAAGLCDRSHVGDVESRRGVKVSGLLRAWRRAHGGRAGERELTACDGRRDSEVSRKMLEVGWMQGPDYGWQRTWAGGEDAEEHAICVADVAAEASNRRASVLEAS